MVFRHLKTRHGYEIDGLWYPRVTSICNIIAKPGLEKWLANQESFSAMQKKRKRITDWGNLIHNQVEKILLGKKPKIAQPIQPSMDAFLVWLKNHHFKVWDIEKKILSKEHGYVGTFDVLGELDGQLGILDIKTSQAVWDEYFIQTTAYTKAYNEQVLKKAVTNWILRIDQYQECKLCGAKRREKGGNPEIKNGQKMCSHKWGAPKGNCELKEVANQELYFDTFLNAKRLWEFSNRDWLSKIKNYPGRFRHI